MKNKRMQEWIVFAKCQTEFVSAFYAMQQMRLLMMIFANRD
jgi:hypothetical protein